MKSIEKIIAIGGSPIKGIGLSDQRLSWTSLYANKYNLQHENLGMAGCTAQSVLRKLITAIHSQSTLCLFIIHWPPSSRFEYVDKTTDEWLSICTHSLPKHPDAELIKKVYFTCINSYLGDKYNTLVNIYSAIQILKNSGHKFIMTADDDFLFQTENHNPLYVEFLQNESKNSFFWFPGNLTWAQWMLEQKYPTDAPATAESQIGYHVREDGHKAAFKYFDSIYTLGL